MKKPALLLSLLFLMITVRSIKTISPGESTTINFFISNPSGSYEFCVDSVLVEFTDHIGDIKVVTPMPAYPKICVCPPSENSSCLSYVNAGKAYGQSQGYGYAPSDEYGFIFNITIDPNAASSLVYPGIAHSYAVHYSYKFVNCKVGCWFENPQQESYPEIIYIHGLTQSELIQAQSGAPSEQLAASSLEDAQQEISDAFNAIEQANNTISLSLTGHCISAKEASAYLSDALDDYSKARSALLAAQDAYNSQRYDEVKYNATIAKQVAVRTKNEADVATNFIQAELQRVEAIADNMKQANLSVSYSLTLETQASVIGVSSSDVRVLNELALEYINKTNSACESGDYDIVSGSADSAKEKANLADHILEPLVSSRLAEIYRSYIENLSRAELWIGNLSANYSNSTIDSLRDYRDNIRNGSYTNFLIYIESLPSTADIVQETVSGFRGLNQTLERMQNITLLAGKYHQELNFSGVDLLLQNSVKELSVDDFNRSLNLTTEANLKLGVIENDLNDKIGKIDNAQTLIGTAINTITEASNDTFLILTPDLSDSYLALKKANAALYSEPDTASSLATQARVLATQQKMKMETTKLGVAGAAIIIIIIGLIISRTRSPFRIRRPLRK